MSGVIKGRKVLKTLLTSQFMREYGMIFVLLLLGLLFSLMTIKQQHPTGAAAGTQVAKLIVANSPNANVLIATRATKEDREFSNAVEKKLNELGANVISTINGEPKNVRSAIEEILASGKTIDAIAANNVTAKWNIYDQFASVGRSKCVTPTPYTWPDFLKVSNLLNVANQTAIYAIIAIGMTMVIITAGIDLSVGSLVALAAVSSAMYIRDAGGTSAEWGTVVAGTWRGIWVCGLAGAFVGITVTRFSLPPFIVTLATMMMARGLALRLAGGESIPELPDSFFVFGGGKALGIPNPIWLMAAPYLLAYIVMSRTVFGRYIYAIGGNVEAARLSGVPVKTVLVIVYTLCGALAGLGGVVLASQLEAGDPKLGEMFELDVIAAVVVGGTSLMGGSGKILGTLIGAFIISVIKNGMNLMGVEAFNQMIVLGAVLLGAVLLDQLKRRK